MNTDRDTSRGRRRSAARRLSTVAAALVAIVAVTAPAPAGATTSTTHDAADAARLTLAVGLDRDGHGPFTPDDDGPGRDADDHNRRVRTFDSVTYRLSVGANESDARHPVVRLGAPDGTTWTDPPGECSGTEDAENVLTCAFDTLEQGSTVDVPVTLGVGGSFRDGADLVVAATFTADDAESVATRSDVVSVSAVPRYDLSKAVDAPVVEPDVTGPDGVTRGVGLTYPIAISWRSPLAGQGLLGSERSDGTFSFEDDVSGMSGGSSSDAQLFASGGRAVCAANTRDRFPRLPGGVGGGVDAVVQSGHFTCTQARPGAPVQVRIDGADTALSPETIPSVNLQGSAIQGGPQPYVVVGYLSLWMPITDGATSFLATNRYTAVRTTSVSGAENEPESLADNVAERNVATFLTGGGYKAISRIGADGTLSAGSAREGDPYVSGHELVASTVELTNPGVGAYRGAIACDVFDVQTLRLELAPALRPTSSGFRNAHVQYAARSDPDPTAARDQPCGDGDATWYDTPDAVPAADGPIGMVRAVGDVAAGGKAKLRLALRTAEVATETRARNFGHLYFGETGDGRWHHDHVDASVGAGGLADSLLIVPDVVRVQKRIVDPGHDATDTPDRTAAVTAGDDVEYAVYPSLTNRASSAGPTTVTTTDTLPFRATYVDGSSSRRPDAITTVTAPDGRPHVRLVWQLHHLTPGEAIPPITYRAHFSKLTPAGAADNTVTVATQGDSSPESYRSAVRGVEVVSGGALSVEKRSVTPSVVVGDVLVWELEYSNTSSTAIQDLDLIDVLPSRRTGSDADTALAAPVPDDPGTGTTVRYTERPGPAVSSDGGDPSNAPGGATRWCGVAAFGTAGCPGDLRDATAIRIVRSAPVVSGDSVTRTLTLRSDSADDGDVLTNRFGLRSGSLTLPVESNRASITVHAGAIGDRVWFDDDHDGRQDPREAGAPDRRLTLTGTDDRGAQIRRATTSDDHGAYAFGALRPGEYTVSIDPGRDTVLTSPHRADDAVDSDFDPTTLGTGPVTVARLSDAGDELIGVTAREDVDAGLLSRHGGGGTEGGGNGSGNGSGTGGGASGSGGNGGGSDGEGTDRDPVGGDGHGGVGRANDATSRAPGVLAFTGPDAPVWIALLMAVALTATGLVVRAGRRRARARR